MLELEKTYLAKHLPEGLENARHVTIEDVYIPDTIAHPSMRVRHQGDKFVLTKKIRIDKNDASRQEELNIDLSPEEYAALSAASSRRVNKTRYYLNWKELTAEVDVFSGPLAGLVLVDFEFKTVEEMQNFEMPDFCLADVSQEDFAAGGKLAGKSYSDIEKDLTRFGYQKIEANQIR